MFNIIKRSYIWLIAGLVLMIGAIALFVLNFRLAIQFTGGVEIKIPPAKIDTKTLKSDIVSELNSKSYNDVDANVASKEGYINLLVTTGLGDDDKVAQLSDDLQEILISKKYVADKNAILELSITGPSIGEYMKNTALYGILFGLLFMAIYMMFSFSAIKDAISPTILAGITIVTMFFDIAIPAGAYGALMMIDPSIQVDTIFIIAILTIMGYSLNDTIIIFDRIRENLTKHKDQLHSGKLTYGKIFEDSLWQTMRRSLGTSVTTFIVVVIMYFLGEGALKIFAFTMGAGIISGSASSILLAAPLAYIMLGKFKKESSRW